MACCLFGSWISAKDMCKHPKMSNSAKFKSSILPFPSPPTFQCSLSPFTQWLTSNEIQRETEEFPFSCQLGPGKWLSLYLPRPLTLYKSKSASFSPLLSPFLTKGILKPVLVSKCGRNVTNRRNSDGPTSTKSIFSIPIPDKTSQS